MNPFSNMLSNVRKGWRTTLLGCILLIASIASVFIVDAVTWTDAAIPIVLSVLLLIAPQGLRKVLLSVLTRKGSALVLYLGIVAASLFLVSCKSSEPPQSAPATKIVSTKTTEAIVKHHFQADSTSLTIKPAEMEVGKPYKSESENTSVTATLDAWGDVSIKAESKERIVRDTITFIQRDTVEVASPCVMAHVDPNAKKDDTRSPSGWIWSNILWPISILVVGAFILLVIVAFMREFIRSVFSAQPK